MLKSVFMLVIFCGSGFPSISGETLQCNFGDVNYFGNLYSCSVTALENPNDSIIITGYSGFHKTNKYDRDVKQIYIDRTNTKYIPANLGSWSNLLALLIDSSQLVEIRSKDFLGMQNLEYLNLRNNKLSSVPSDAFSSLTKLKYLRLMSNQIQEISSELFSNNLNLEVIDFDENRIKYIGSDVFNKLRNLNKVEFEGNICLQKDYIGIDGIIQMKKDIITNCKNPATTTTTTTKTTQNPMEVELEALKNEAIDQKLKNEIELNKLRDDLKKEQMENSRIRIERDTLKKIYDASVMTKDALMNDRESLKMELNNKTSEINELKTHCEHSNEAGGAVDVKFNEIMNHLLKVSQEHQMECNEIIKLRAELVSTKDVLKMANDQLKKEQEEIIKVTKERDQLDKTLTEELTDLKMELTKAKDTIDQKLPKMEQLIEDFYMEVMDLKIERHNERQNSIGLRSKLMKANEQLAECKNE